MLWWAVHALKLSVFVLQYRDTPVPTGIRSSKTEQRHLPHWWSHSVNGEQWFVSPRCSSTLCSLSLTFYIGSQQSLFLLLLFFENLFKQDWFWGRCLGETVLEPAAWHINLTCLYVQLYKYIYVCKHVLVFWGRGLVRSCFRWISLALSSSLIYK